MNPMMGGMMGGMMPMMMPQPGVMPGMPGTGFYNSLPGRFGRDMLGRGVSPLLRKLSDLMLTT
jgi:hypothetical protein